MSARRILAALLPLSLASVSSAHVLDEYLQAGFVAVERDRWTVDLYLTPGLMILPGVLAAIDTNADGRFSEAEQHEYAARVRKDLRFAIDGREVSAELVALEFPSPAQLRDAAGDIHLVFAVKLPADARPTRLRFENHHQPGIAAYQVNCLAAHDSAVRIGRQQRDDSQSVYEVEVGFAPQPAAAEDARSKNIPNPG